MFVKNTILDYITNIMKAQIDSSMNVDLMSTVQMSSILQ